MTKMLGSYVVLLLPGSSGSGSSGGFSSCLFITGTPRLPSESSASSSCSLSDVDAGVDVFIDALPHAVHEKTITASRTNNNSITFFINSHPLLYRFDYEVVVNTVQ